MVKLLKAKCKPVLIYQLHKMIKHTHGDAKYLITYHAI